jgi:hypothetical protein
VEDERHREHGHEQPVHALEVGALRFLGQGGLRDLGGRRDELPEERHLPEHDLAALIVVHRNRAGGALTSGDALRGERAEVGGALRPLDPPLRPMLELQNVALTLVREDGVRLRQVRLRHGDGVPGGRADGHRLTRRQDALLDDLAALDHPDPEHLFLLRRHRRPLLSSNAG